MNISSPKLRGWLRSYGFVAMAATFISLAACTIEEEPPVDNTTQDSGGLSDGGTADGAADKDSGAGTDVATSDTAAGDDVAAADAGVDAAVDASDPDGGSAGVCGDGKVTTGEDCDDGNDLDGDGCSADCKIEAGYECVNPVDINTGSNGAGAQAALGSNDLQWETAFGKAHPDDGTDYDKKAVERTPATPPTDLKWQPAIVVDKCVGSWKSVDASKAAQWINTEGWDGAKKACKDPKTCTVGQMYYYRVKFDIASESAANASSLAGTLWADNQITRIWINGKQVTEYKDPTPGASSFTGDGIDFAGWKGYFKAGQNDLTIAVANFVSPACPNPQGLVVSVDLSKGSVCSKKPAGGSCTGKCGKFTSGDPCQCDVGCVESNDCCADFDKICKGTCGDGIKDLGEACDDKNTADGDGCSKDCAVESGFTCTDDGKGSVCTKVTASCSGKCGPFAPGAPCQCDELCKNAGDCCSDYDKFCGAKSVCGNAILEAGEECDDLNTKDGDGCSKDCKIEAGYECASSVDINTGSDGAGKQAQLGTDDVRWQVALGKSWPNTTTQADKDATKNTPATPPAGLTYKAAKVVQKCVGSWQTVDASKAAQWITAEGWNSTTQQCIDAPKCNDGQLYYYRVKFNLLNAATAAATSLQGKLWADNVITKIWLNNKEVTQYTAPTYPASSFTGAGIDFAGWKGYYKAGENELVVAIANFSSKACPNPEGLVLAVDLKKGSVCTKKATCTPQCAGKTCGPDGCGGTCGTCDDKNGCTADSCSAAGTCSNVACSTGSVSWNKLTAPKGGVATKAAPYTFQIDGWKQDISMYRTGNQSKIKLYTAPATKDGSFSSTLIPNLKFAWTGTFPYIDILTEKYGANGPKVEGIVTFDFGKAAKERGASWRYVLVIGGLAGPGDEGPTQVKCDAPLAFLGEHNSFATGQFSTFTPPSTLATGKSGKTEGLSFFTLPADTKVVNCTIKSLGGTIPDQHGYAVGMVDMDVSQCLGTGATAKCAGNTCGDGLTLGSEACDDGNTTDGDGCTKCQVDANWTCTGDLTSVCKKNAVCGNAVLEGDEECDDLNTKDGDGCSKDCKIEDGYECASSVDINTGSTGAGVQAKVGTDDVRWQTALGGTWPSTSTADDKKAVAATPATPPKGLTWKPAGVVQKCVGSWATADPKKAAQWISTEGWNATKNACMDPTSCSGGQLYYYRTKFNIVNAATAAATSLQGKLWADNKITAIWINDIKVKEFSTGDPSASSFTGPGTEFAGWKGYYKAGENVITVAVANFHTAACPNPQGLLMSVDLAKGSVCTKKCGAFGQECCPTTGGASACASPFACDASSKTCKCSTGGAVCGGACCKAGEYCKEGKCADPATEKCLEIFKPAATVLNPNCVASKNCHVSCKAELAANPAAKSGIYLVQPDPAKAAFQVQCDMLIDGGGWTLVGFEPSGAPAPGNSTGVMAQMAKETPSVDPTKLALATAAGFIGPRFAFKTNYKDARLTWCTAAKAYRYQTFTATADLFANTVTNKPVTATKAAGEMIPLTNFSSNDSALNAQLANPNDAAFCRAYAGAKIPGDTSWGVKQKNESSNQCGCNSGGWKGTGSYYGGKGGGGNNDGCVSQGGGWAGTAGNGVKKGGQNSNTTYFWVR